MSKLVLANLMQRPTRTVTSCAAISLGMVLVLVSIGLTNGILSDSATRAREIGGDLIVQAPNESLLFALNSGILDARVGSVIERVDGVAAVTPVLTKFVYDQFHLVFGVDTASFKQVNSSLRFRQGRFFESGDEVIIDTLYAETRSLAVGDELTLLGSAFQIVGIYEKGIASRVMMPLEKLQALNQSPAKVSMFFVRVEAGRDASQVRAELIARMRGYRITETSELKELMVSSTPVYNEFISAVIGLSVVISFLMVLLAMYSTITERTREIGILKSLGASKASIAQLILKESTLICSLGIGLGFALTFASIHLILVAFPSMQIVIPPFWHLSAAALAVGGGTLGALYPAMKAARLDPVKALGYE